MGKAGEFVKQHRYLVETKKGFLTKTYIYRIKYFHNTDRKTLSQWMWLLPITKDFIGGSIRTHNLLRNIITNKIKLGPEGFFNSSSGLIMSLYNLIYSRTFEKLRNGHHRMNTFSRMLSRSPFTFIKHRRESVYRRLWDL